MKDSLDHVRQASTHWTVLFERFRLSMYLDPIHDLTYLKSFIDYQTKGNTITPSLTVNGVPGVTHGDYEPLRTWIDWHFKKGDMMLCLNLQSRANPR